MDTWIIWVVAAVVLAVGEILTVSFWIGPFAVGAAAAAVADAAGAGDLVPWLLFFAVSGLVLAVVRPISRAHRHMPPRLRTGTAALVGRPAVVVDAIGGPESAGQVRIDGEVWSARAYDGEEHAAGSEVHVMEIRGATALVS
jgi:membrane protein implicated in regulation of membrane protease activity